MAPRKTAAEKAKARSLKEIMGLLAELGGQVQDDDIVYGDKLTLREGMSLDDGIMALARKKDELETDTSYTYSYDYRPWDGAYCMWNALKRQFGSISHQGRPGFMFFPGEPPRMISVPSGVNERTEVPWGDFQLPGFEGVLFTTEQTDHPEFGPLFVLTAYGPKKYEAGIKGVFQVVEDELKTNSMYRGKAFDGQPMPEFVDLSTVDPNLVVYSQDVLRQLRTNIWRLLRNTDVYERRKLPLKRAVLLHGPFGTGKTLAAILTGQEAIANGWTFIKGRPGRDGHDNLEFVMQTARLYQPAVVFYEDLDQVADAGMGQDAISRLLDNFDGIEAKGTRILCVLTTNYPERIQQGMGRPGRLDAFIEIDDLDLEGVEKLITARVGDMLTDGIDWQAVYVAAQGYKPAFVTELAGRAVTNAIDRNDGDDSNIQLVTDDLVSAAHDLRPQFNLYTGAKDRVETPQLETAMRTMVEGALRKTVNENLLVGNGSD